MADQDAGYVSAEDDDYRPEFDLAEKAEAARDKAEADNTDALRVRQAMLVRETRSRIEALGPVCDALSAETTNAVIAALPSRWVRKRRRASKSDVLRSQQSAVAPSKAADTRWQLTWQDASKMPLQARTARHKLHTIVTDVCKMPSSSSGQLNLSATGSGGPDAALITALGASSGPNAGGSVDGLTRSRLGLPADRRQGKRIRLQTRLAAGSQDLHNALLREALKDAPVDFGDVLLIATASQESDGSSNKSSYSRRAQRLAQQGPPSHAAILAARAAADIVGLSTALETKQVVFAGEVKTIQVAASNRQGAAASSASRVSAGRSTTRSGGVGGLAAAAASLEEPERVSTLAASSADWEAKKRQEGFADDVERFAKDGYVSRQSFLAQASEAEAAAAKSVRDQGSRSRRRQANKEFERRMGASANKD